MPREVWRNQNSRLSRWLWNNAFEVVPRSVTELFFPFIGGFCRRRSTSVVNKTFPSHRTEEKRTNSWFRKTDRRMKKCHLISTISQTVTNTPLSLELEKGVVPPVLADQPKVQLTKLHPTTIRRSARMRWRNEREECITDYMWDWTSDCVDYDWETLPEKSFSDYWICIKRKKKFGWFCVRKGDLIFVYTTDTKSRNSNFNVLSFFII